MNSLILTIFILLGSNALAAELQGSGTALLSAQRPDGQVFQLKTDCQVTMDFLRSSSHLSLGSPSYDCRNVNPWQDPSAEYRIHGGRIVDSDGNDSGHVLPDGSLEISHQSTETKTYYRLTLDARCKITSHELVPVTTQTELTYQLQQNADLSVKMDRRFMTQTVGHQRRSKGAYCPAVLEPVALTSRADVSTLLRSSH